MESHHYPPVGECIYCGADRYTPNSDRKLADEHIIPLSLGGQFILQEASCQACERVTGRIDSIATNNHLIGSRRHMGLRGRTPLAKLPTEIPIFAERDGKERKVMVEVEDCPAALYLPELHNPPAFDALLGQRSQLLVGMFVRFFNFKPEVLREKYGIGDWSTVNLDTRVFCRMLAKTAHSYAVAQLGVRGFNPILRDLLRDPDRDSRDVLPFVGGMPPRPPEPAPPNTATHTMRDARITIAKTGFVTVEIRLFASFGAPIYMVAVGTEVGQPMPPLSDNPGGVDALRNLYKISVPAE